VRGAIDITAIAAELASFDGPAGASAEESHRNRVLDAGMLALSARNSLDEASDRTPEAVIRDIWERHFFSGPGGGRANRS
jgi:MoxR-like ATPase